MDLQNKVIAITGGASGLGEATLRNFVAQGAKVAILDLNADNANKLVDELGSDNVLFINTNIMEEQPVIDAIDQIEKTFGALHVCVNCCLLYTSPSPRDLSTSRMPSSA